MQRTLLSVLAIGLSIALLAAARGEDAETKQQRPILVLSGPSSAVAVPAYHRIMKSDSLENVWLAHQGKTREQAFTARGTLLDVDLEHSMVVAIFLGDSFNCRGLAVESVVESKDQVRLRFSGLTYQTSGAGTAVRPYALIVLPRSSKPLAIEEDVQDLIGRPPIWKEQARFPVVESPQPR